MVPRLVEEEPLAGVVSARLHAQPRSVSHGGHQRPDHSGQEAVDTARRGSEVPARGVIDGRNQRRSPSRTIHGCHEIAPQRPTAVGKREGPDPFPDGHRSAVRIAGDLFARIHRAGFDEPIVQLLGRGEFVSS